MTRTILHLADVHLETPFVSSGLPPAVGARRRQELCETLKRALSLARKHHVDAVTVAGDLYDGHYALPETGDLLAAAFASLAPIPVIIAPGCADAYAQDDGVYALTRWPENVTILPPGPPSVVKVTPDLSIWGAAWSPDGLPEPPEVKGGGMHLLLMHAGQAASGGGEPALPDVLAPAVLRAAGYTQALLGGRHVGSLWPEDDPYACFPGSLEPLATEEMAGCHGAVLVHVEGEGRCTHEWLPVGRWRYVSAAVDMSDCTTPEEAARRIEAALKHDRVRTDARAIATVSVTGLPEGGLDLAEVRALIDARAHVAIRMERPLPYDLDRLAQEHTVRGLLVRRLRASKGGQRDDHDLRLSALHLALQALDGKGVRPSEIA